DLDITPHRKLVKEGFKDAEGKRIELEDAFKEGDHPFRVAIARANRVAEGKNNGLIVDNCGILKNLRKALADFGGAGDDGRDEDKPKDPTRPNEELLAELAETIDMVKTFLSDCGFELTVITEYEGDGFRRNVVFRQATDAAKEAINENDQTRKQFEVMAREVFKKFKACINIRPDINAYRLDRDAINLIYRSLQSDREKADISHIMRQLHQLVDDSVTVTSSRVEESKVYDISQIDFERLRQEFARIVNKKTVVVNLRDAIAVKLAMLLKQNPLRTDFQKHFEEVVEGYNSEKDRVTIEQTFENLFKFHRLLDEEDSRAMRENLTDETLVLFDMLKKPTLSKKEIDKIKKVAVKLLASLKKEKLNIDNWREKEATRDAVKQGIYDYLYDERTGLPVESYEEEEISGLTDALFNHVYWAYPTVPSPIYGGYVDQ
ncbi:type I restriction endonuclease subunit R, partial [Pseudomonadota bacterium]